MNSVATQDLQQAAKASFDPTVPALTTAAEVGTMLAAQPAGPPRTAIYPTWQRGYFER